MLTSRVHACTHTAAISRLPKPLTLRNGKFLLLPRTLRDHVRVWRCLVQPRMTQSLPLLPGRSHGAGCHGGGWAVTHLLPPRRLQGATSKGANSGLAPSPFQAPPPNL